MAAPRSTSPHPCRVTAPRQRAPSTASSSSRAIPSFLLCTLSFLLAFSLPSTLAVIYHDYYGPYGGDPWLTWDEDYRLNNKSHATPPFAPRPSFGGCYIAQGSGVLLDDLDCDKVPDVSDNCRGVPNTDQRDQNKNGLGDACDLVVDAIRIDPGVVLEDRPFIVTAALTNYRALPISNIELTIQVPELGLDQKAYVDRLEPGQQGRYEFFLRVPGCTVAKEYDVVLFIAFPQSPGVKEFFYIPTRMAVQSNGLCQEEPTLRGKSIITILDVQDIDPVLGGSYPFTIVNGEPESQAYVLTVQGTEEWGSYLIEPRSLIVVPAGETREGRLTLFAKKGVTGEHGFILTLRSKADAQQLVLSARVKDELPGRSLASWLQFGIFILCAIILVAAFALLHLKRGKR